MKHAMAHVALALAGPVGRMAVTRVAREVGWDLNPWMRTAVQRRSAVLLADSIQRSR